MDNNKNNGTPPPDSVTNKLLQFTPLLLSLSNPLLFQLFEQAAISKVLTKGLKEISVNLLYTPDLSWSKADLDLLRKQKGFLLKVSKTTRLSLIEILIQKNLAGFKTVLRVCFKYWQAKFSDYENLSSGAGGGSGEGSKRKRQRRRGDEAAVGRLGPDLTADPKKPRGSEGHGIVKEAAAAADDRAAGERGGGGEGGAEHGGGEHGDLPDGDGEHGAHQRAHNPDPTPSEVTPPPPEGAAVGGGGIASSEPPSGRRPATNQEDTGKRGWLFGLGNGSYGQASVVL